MIPREKINGFINTMVTDCKDILRRTNGGLFTTIAHRHGNTYDFIGAPMTEVNPTSPVVLSLWEKHFEDKATATLSVDAAAKDLMQFVICKMVNGYLQTLQVANWIESNNVNQPSLLAEYKKVAAPLYTYMYTKRAISDIEEALDASKEGPVVFTKIVHRLEAPKKGVVTSQPFIVTQVGGQNHFTPFGVPTKWDSTETLVDIATLQAQNP